MQCGSGRKYKKCCGQQTGIDGFPDEWHRERKDVRGLGRVTRRMRDGFSWCGQRDQGGIQRKGAMTRSRRRFPPLSLRPCVSASWR
ncbi:MAG: SEC-C domain-containing protein [Planctomycetes bacterium]|nr:SEC-C domain-containing protein [Planctomycetota bacterium]